MDYLILFMVLLFGAYFLYIWYVLAENKKHPPPPGESAGELLVDLLDGAVDPLVKRHQRKQKCKAELQAAWNYIRPGLSEEEVLKHLGPPDDVIPVEPLVWSYRSGKLTGFVMFQDGIVVGYKKPEKLKAKA